MRNISERLLDIQDAIERILKYTQDGRYRYDRDELVRTWVTHNLYIIGEAAPAVASDFPDFKDQHPEIKWTEIISMRTILAHRYFDIDPDALWEAVNQELQDLRFSIDAILERRNKKGDRWGLNPQPLEPQSRALPIELRSPCF